jgi:hypothetical protein
MIPSPLSKAQLLPQLEQRILSDVKDAWLFPQRGAVSGFLGTAPFVIVGWRPSWSPFPNDGANKLFYEILVEFGLENAHLTNIIKSRGHKDEPDPSNLALHEEIFARELEILDAWHGVVPMGSAYERVAALTMNHGAKPIARLPQFASMNYGQSQIDAFRKAIGDLAAIARRNGWISSK